MIYEEARYGRVFILRLEHGEVLHEVIERFAADRSIRAALVFALGGADGGSRLVVGPEDGDARPVSPMARVLAAPHEIMGVGTLFPDDAGQPMLHLHLAAGRGESTTTGCVRQGVLTWQVGEVAVLELLDTGSVRRLDPALGFKLLRPPEGARGPA